MSKIDNGVPWTEGRRALVHHNTFDGHGPRWVSAVGITRSVFAHNAKWPSCALWALVGRPDDFEWASDAVTILEPGQCRECYEIDAHTETCARGKRIADNRARGVPAFWAEWVHIDAPPAPDASVSLTGGLRAITVYVLYGYTLMAPAGYAESLGRWVWAVGTAAPGEAIRGVGFLALGPDGPTVEPWGL